MAELDALTEAVNVVLMDVHMPEMDGCTATRLIRASPRTARLPIAALTADVVGDRESSVLEAGMDAFLSKPFEVSEAVALILRLTGGRQDAEQTPENAPEATPTGIDLERGLAIWGDLETYRGYVRRFAESHADVFSPLLSDDSEAAGALAHKLKGTAANLGLTDVAARAAELEHALKQDGPELPLEIDTRLAALKDALDAVARFIG